MLPVIRKINIIFCKDLMVITFLILNFTIIKKLIIWSWLQFQAIQLKLFNKYSFIFAKIIFSEIILIFIQAKNFLIKHKNTFNTVKNIKKNLCFDFKNLLFEIEFPKFSWNDACWMLFIFQYFIKTALRDKFISCVLILIE